MARRYDPDRAPDPKQWQAAGEDENIQAVLKYHRQQRIKLPSARAHAVFHVIVENQVAMGDEIPVARTLARLIREGLSRHDGIHAIGSVLSGHMYDLAKNQPASGDPNASYYRAIEQLTAQGWLSSCDDEDDDERA